MAKQLRRANAVFPTGIFNVHRIAHVRQHTLLIGRPLIANPDFVSCLKEGRELRTYDPALLETLD